MTITTRSPLQRIAIILAVVWQIGATFLPQLGLGDPIGDRSDSIRTLITPSGWAFAIWGPLFFGSACFAVWQALPKQAAEAMGSIDILINNAGITRDNLFMRMSDDEWESVLNVNLTSTMRLCRGVLRGMMKARHGRIVNISSVVGATGNPGQGNYAASKAGMVGMSKSLAAEVASRGTASRPEIGSIPDTKD